MPRTSTAQPAASSRQSPAGESSSAPSFSGPSSSGQADLDLRLLRYFVTLAEHGSFTAAAGALDLSQPALSQGIRRLEDLVGTALLTRAPQGSSRPSQLTPAGQALLPEARDLLAHASRVMKRARADAARLTLRVGFGTSTPNDLVRALLDCARDTTGDRIAIRMVFLGWGEEFDALRRGDVDVAFAHLQQSGPDEAIHTTPLCTTGRLAIFAADHPLASAASVRIADLGEEPIVDAESDRDYWIVNPRPDGRSPRTVGPRARTVDEMLTLVSTGIGMGITCSSVAEKHRWPNLAFVPIADLAPARISLTRLRAESRRPVMRLLEDFTAAEIARARSYPAPGAPATPLA